MKTFIMILISIITLSCLSKNKHDGQASTEAAVLSQNDPRVKRSVALAQDSLPFFVETFNNLHDHQDYNFFIKTTLGNSATTPIWAKPFKVSNNQFSCTLDSSPGIAGYAFGDTIQVGFDSIKDYMIILGDSVIGNYLQKELKKDASGEPQ